MRRPLAALALLAAALSCGSKPTSECSPAADDCAAQHAGDECAGSWQCVQVVNGSTYYCACSVVEPSRELVDGRPVAP